MREQAGPFRTVGTRRRLGSLRLRPGSNTSASSAVCGQALTERIAGGQQHATDAARHDDEDALAARLPGMMLVQVCRRNHRFKSETAGVNGK